MTEFKIMDHEVRPYGKVIEIHHPEEGLIGVIYPTERGVRIVSKRFSRDCSKVTFENTELPVLEIAIV